MIALRTATVTDLALVLDWAAEEGWNPGLDDAAAFHAADPDGFFVAARDEAPVGAISVVNHTSDFAFLGLYIVKPEFRGQGIGCRLWNHGIAHAGARTIGLDGVPAQQDNYRSSGFEFSSATTRYSGTLAARHASGVRLAEEEDIPGLIALEAARSGAIKPRYLSAWFRATEHRKTLVLDSEARDAGFCTVRQCRQGAKIGPLWAPGREIADALLHEAVGVFGGTVSLDVPRCSTGLDRLCLALGLGAGFDTARMYRGPFAPPVSEYFAVTSLELG